MRVLAVGVFVGWLGSSLCSAAEPLDFNRDIRPILSRNCFACHGPDEAFRKADLRLDTQAGSTAELPSGARAIVPGQAANSELVLRITSTDPVEKMPPPDVGHDLTPGQIEILKRWVAEGGTYAEHWSFVKPQRPELPAVKQTNWPRNGLDYFVLAKLEANGLKPSAEADRRTIIRRLSLDLRGLPPTPQEVQEFLADQRPDAYEQLVDKFLNDTAYGERWARMWLDLARYADSKGHGSDPLRTIWRYRDWVIDAFNRNLPYDQFTREQLAGDLLPDSTVEQRIATAFHRNTLSNDEGGTDDEEFRVVAVKDRVDTTLQVWMGLTMGCAKCHNHKFDPLSQAEYYSFYAFFNQTADADRPDETPLLQAPTPAMKQESADIERQLADLRKKLELATPELAAAQANWEQELAADVKWEPLADVTGKSEQGATLTPQADGSLLASGKNPDRDVFQVQGRTGMKAITAIRLEALTDPSLPKGVGRADDGNFVLSRLSATMAEADRAGQAPRGRFVRIENTGKNRLLSLAEVEVFSGGKNIAPEGKASQSSVDYDGPPQLAIDGNTNGNYYEGKSTTHTKQEDNPWWEVDLGSDREIERVQIWNRTDNGTGGRLANFQVTLLSADKQPVWQQTVAESPNPSRELSPTGEVALTFAVAQADYSQPNFAVQDVLQGKNPSQNGWAVGPNMQQPHQAVFSLKSPGPNFEKSQLTVRLEHSFNMPRYALGKFRLSVTNDPKIGRRTGVPLEILAILDLPADNRTEAQAAQLSAHYRSISPELKPIRDEIARLEAAKPVFPTVPVLEELPADRHRETFVMVKGNFLDKGEVVTAHTPSHFHAWPEAAPLNRLGVAEWIMHPENPLTARVAVNRYWAQLFGTGIVRTEEDFGTQGDWPTHPQLLDWLAVEFRDSKWDIKRLLKTIVTSATYRQSSSVTPELLEKDPHNQLFTRGPRFRLEAEIVRDQALALSGLLSHKTHGPSVYPYQPPGLWQAAFNGQRTWSTSQGEDKYRRGLYTFWRRTVPYPSMAAFDAPSREVCAIRRIRTNTPLQAFVTLNDPVYVEASQALGRRIVKESPEETPEGRVRFGLELCLAREAEPVQVQELLQLYQEELAYYQQHTDEAGKLATDPLGPVPAGLPAPEAAAWTVVANVLLNLDGVLTKN